MLSPGALFWFYTFIAIMFKSTIIAGIVNQNVFLQASIWRVLASVPTYMVYAAFLLILLSFSFLLNRRQRLWFLITTNMLFTTLLLLDLWYFRAFSSFLTVYTLKQFSCLENLSNSIYSFVSWFDLIFVFDIPFAIWMAYRKKHLYADAKRSIPVFACLVLLSTVYLAYAHYEFDLSPDRGKKQYLFLICWTPGQTISDLSPIGYHLFDAFNYFNECRQLELTDGEREEIRRWYEAKQENLPDNQYKGIFKGKNVIYIQVESLEKFYLQNQIDGKEITPNINRMLKNSLYFSEIHEQVNVGTTSDGELMANTSVYPIRVGATYFRYPYNRYLSMPVLLERMGYSTIAIHPDNKAYWNWMTNMQSIGYQKCVDSAAFQMDEVFGLGLSDGSFFRQAEPIILQQKKPFMAFMITLTNHTTFELADKYKELHVDKKFNGTMIGASFHTVHYTDRQIGELLERLDKQGVLDDTVIVVSGDHCGVHKFYPEEMDTIQPPDEWWYDNHHHVPFIVYQKQLQGQEIKVTGGQVDIMPTLAYLLGVDEAQYKNSAMGRNLLKTNKNFAVLYDGELIGKLNGEKEEEHAIQGLEIADKIIRSSYFGKRED